MPKVHVATPDGQRETQEESEVREGYSAEKFPAGSLYWMAGMSEWRPIEEFLPRELSTTPPPLPAIFPPAHAAKQTSNLAIAAIALAAVACAAGLVATAFVFLRLRSTSLGLVILLGLGAAVLSLVVASIASRRIQISNGTLGGRKLVVASQVLVVLLFVWSFVAPIMPPRHPHNGPIDARNLRQIGQGSLIYANDYNDVLPPAVISENGGKRTATLHDVAKLLAQSGGINDTSLWFSNQDKALRKESRQLQTTVLDREKETLNPEFAEQQVFAFDYVTGLRTDLPSTTPIAWTRGLRLDGRWDSGGVYGAEGGHIIFLGGNVSFYTDLGPDENPRLVSTNGEPTSNILDALPPGARIVGGGPASLNGYFKPAETKPPESGSPERRQIPRVPEYEMPRIKVARSSRETNAAKFLAIGTASRGLFQKRGYLPTTISDEHGVKSLTIHDVAVILAAYAGLTDAQAWFSPTDLTLSDGVKTLTDVLSPAGKIDPDFANQKILSVDYVTGLTNDAPQTTPIAWTRGLQENGKWHSNGACGNDGGHILFVDGNAWYYDTLGSKTVTLTGLDGEPTSNILETLPPGARIVGAGPATLNGTEVPQSRPLP